MRHVKAEEFRVIVEIRVNVHEFLNILTVILKVKKIRKKLKSL